MAGVNGVPKAIAQQSAADSQGSRTCVCADTYPRVWHMQERKDELTSCRGYRLDDVAKTSSETQREEELGCPKRVSDHVVRGTTVLTYPGKCAQVTGKAGETVNIQVKWAAAHPGQDRRLPSVATHLRL